MFTEFRNISLSLELSRHGAVGKRNNKMSDKPQTNKLEENERLGVAGCSFSGDEKKFSWGDNFCKAERAVMARSRGVTEEYSH